MSLIYLPIYAQEDVQATPIVTTDSVALANSDSVSAVTLESLYRYLPATASIKRGKKR